MGAAMSAAAAPFGQTGSGPDFTIVTAWLEVHPGLARTLFDDQPADPATISSSSARAGANRTTIAARSATEAAARSASAVGPSTALRQARRSSVIVHTAPCGSVRTRSQAGP